MRARTILAERSRRALIFPHMEEPGWLILLDLLANDGRDICVTSACLASFTPATTALRYIGLLERDGLVRREADPNDARRVFVRLTDEARQRLDAFFAPALREAA